MKSIAFLLLLASLPALCQETPKHKVIRRILAAAACATSAYDGYQTARAIGRGGIYELNPIGFNGKMLTFKAAACAAPLIVGELGAKHSNGLITNFALAADALQTGVFTFVIAHNERVIQKERVPGQLAGR